jgi:hypothetical protein
MEAQHLAQRMAHREARIERRVRILKDHLGPPPQRTQLSLAAVRDVPAFQFDEAGLDVVEAQQRSCQSGFAAAAFADQANCFVAVDGQADAIDGAQPRCRPAKHEVGE